MTPDEVKAQYASAAKTYTQDEQRQAAHILIAVKPDATDADRAAAKKKAEDLAAQAKANPAKFAELAKQYSQDPGSAAQGGDLGSNPRGTMVKAFDDAVFAMKPGEIVGPVQSEFGWHVIRLVGVTPAQDAAVRRGEGADRDRSQAAEDRAEIRGRRRPVPESGLRAGRFARAGRQGAGPRRCRRRRSSRGRRRSRSRWAAPSSCRRCFSPESIAAKRNTDAIEVGPNALMAARLVEYKPAAPRPFDDVKDEIRRQLVRQGAVELAQKAGREKLALLEQGKSDRDAGVDVREAGGAVAQPAAAGVHARRGRRGSSRPTRRSCRTTSARRASAADSRSTSSST